MLNYLSPAVPANVTLKSLSGDLSTDTGPAGSSMRGSISAPAITITGCAPGQTQVARLMARLHDIDGVTRVSLSKSAAEEADVDASSGSAVERRNAAPCGAGKRPSFEMVMFFEKDAAAVATTP